MALPKAITLRELGPREGFQTLPQIVHTERKLALIDALSVTGVKEIEVTSFVRSERVPQMADAEELITKLKKQPDVIYRALYLNERGFERGEQTGKIENTGWLYLAASETFLKKNNNTTLAEQVHRIPQWIELFQKYQKSLEGLMISTAFGCNYEGEIPSKKVLDIIDQVLKRAGESGAKLQEISLADTMGWGDPEQVRALVGQVRSKYPDLTVSLHFHDTRGTGMANVYAGLLEGVDIFECSVAGLGGCPFAKGAAGNVPTEDVAFMCEELGIKTGVDLRRYAVAAQLAQDIVGHELPGKYYKSVRYAQK